MQGGGGGGGGGGRKGRSNPLLRTVLPKASCTVLCTPPDIDKLTLASKPTTKVQILFVNTFVSDI